MALVGAVAASAVLTGCGGFNKDKKEGEKKTEAGGEAKANAKEFRVAISADVPDLDPALCSDNQSSFLDNQVFQSLTYISLDGTAKPDAAEKVEHSEDNKTWTFTLRDGLKFSNGDPITAEDFKYSWLRTLSPELASGQANRLYPIVGAQAYNEGKGKAEDVKITVKDPKTLVVELNDGNAYFDEVAAYPVYSVVNKKIVEANKEWFTKPETYIGSGAYTLDKMELGKEITLKKNPNYWDAANVDVETVKISIIKDENTVFQKFKAKELDYVGSPVHSIPTDAMDEAKKMPEYKAFPNTQIYWFKVNTKKEFVSNVHMRRALAFAINRQEIIDNITKGDQKVATGYVPQFDSKLFKDNDQEGAKAELAKAMEELGITDASKINVALSFNTSEAHQKIAQAVQAQWKAVLGINAELKNEEWKVYLDTLKEGNYQVGRLGWVADYTDPADFLNMYMYENGDDNMTYWHSDAYNAKIEEANKYYSEPEKRNELLKEAEKMIVDDMPAIPVYFGTVPSLIGDNVEKAQCTLLGNLFIKDVKMK